MAVPTDGYIPLSAVITLSFYNRTIDDYKTAIVPINFDTYTVEIFPNIVDALKTIITTAYPDYTEDFSQVRYLGEVTV